MAEHEVNRSAEDGKFVTEDKAQRDPSTTTTEQVGGDHTGGDHEVHRSADDGKFVAKETADDNPETTESQRV